MNTQSLRSGTEDKHNVLFSLPTKMVHNILSEWIDLSSVVKLDTAVCQHPFRALYLTILSSDQFYIPSLCALSRNISDPDPHNPTADTKRLRWLLARNVKVRQIEFAYDCQIRAVSDYLEIFGEHVQRVKHYTPFADFRNRRDQMSSMLFGLLGVGHQTWPGGADFGQDNESQGKTIAAHCTKLTTYHCYMLGMSDEGFVRVLSSNHGLQQLTVEGNYLGPGNATSVAQVRLPGLRQLTFMTKYGFDEVLTAFARAAPNLEKLQIVCNPDKCAELPRGLIAEVGRQCPKLRSFSSRELDLGPNDVDLTPFLQTCPNLVNLDLQSHLKLTDDTLIAAFSCLKELHAVNLSFCSKLTDRSLTFLAERFASTLQVLLLSGCKNMTPSAIDALRSKCTQLHSCHSVYNCESIDVDQFKMTTIWQVIDLTIDTDVHALLEYAQQLQVLDLSESEGEILIAEELLDIARGCPNLHTVVVSARENRKGECLAMQQAFPKLLFTTDKLQVDFDVLAMPV
eukprot:gene11690-13578_t